MRKQNYPLHIFLFLVTIFTTLLAGAEMVTGRSFFGDSPHVLGFEDLLRGIPFSFAFLLFLTVHEFGHFFTAVYHKVRCSLPYYIPIFIPYLPFNIGSFGAVIRIRQIPPSRRIYFDIGVAGPLAGFVIALGLLVYGLLSLPPLEPTIMAIHPEYAEAFGHVPSLAELRANSPGVPGVGSNLLLWILQRILPIDASQMPPSFEMMHYPFIFVGYLTCFFTALNLLPIGQLDGGHVTYGLFGRRIASTVSRVAVIALLLLGGTGVMQLDPYEPEYYGNAYWFALDQAVEFAMCLGLYIYVFVRMFPRISILRAVGMALALGGFQYSFNVLMFSVLSNPVWLMYAFIAVRLLGVDHPEALDSRPLSTRQKWLGVLAILIFILSFTPAPIVML